MGPCLIAGVALVLAGVRAGDHAVGGAPLSHHASESNAGQVAADEARLARSSARWIENKGQWKKDACFVATLPGVRVNVACGAIELEVPTSSAGRSDLIKLCFESPSGEAEVVGVERQPGIYNYFIGDDPSQWVTRANAYASVRYVNLYRGIDLEILRDESGLRCELLAAPGADLNAVTVRCEGMRSLQSLADGDLAAMTASGQVVYLPRGNWKVSSTLGDAPRLKWRLDTERVRPSAESEAGHDPSSLTKPVSGLLWSTYLGSSSNVATGDFANAVAYEPNGTVVVAGVTEGADFPQTKRTVQDPQGTSRYFFATKFNSVDGTLIYSSIIGGGSQGALRDVAVDAAGRATTVGWTQALNHPVTTGAYDTMRGSGFFTGWVTQFTPSGDAFVYSTYLEGTINGSDAFTVSALPTGSVVVGGAALSSDFPTTVGAFDRTYQGSTEAFITKLNPTGSALEWSTFLGGADSEGVYELALDAQGVVTVFGRTSSHHASFPTTLGAYKRLLPQSTPANNFVARLSANGASLLWCTYLGSNNVNEDSTPYDLGLSSDGSTVLVGQTRTNTYPTTRGAFQTQFAGGNTSQAFVTRLASNGGSLIYSTLLGAPANAGAIGTSVDSSGVATVACASVGDFPTTPGAYDTIVNTFGDMAIVKLSPMGDRLFYSTYIGGASTDVPEASATSPTGRTTLVGYTYANGEEYPITPGALQPEYVGGQTDGIVSTLDLYLQGVCSSGASIPACLGPLTMNAARMPSAGDTAFSLYCSAAPPLANGWLVLGRPTNSSTPQSSARMSVDLRQFFIAMPVQSNTAGYVETSLPLPSTWTGKSFSAQYVFTNPPGCTGTGPRSTSNGLVITVQ